MSPLHGVDLLLESGDPLLLAARLGTSDIDLLGEALGNLWRNIANEIIRQLARIAAMEVFKGLFGGLFPSVNFGRLFQGGFQRGGELIVTRPTLLMAGEAGPERARIEPLATAFAGDERQRPRGGPAQITLLMPLNIQALDSRSIVQLFQEQGDQLADLVAERLRANTRLGRLMQGISA